MHRENKCITPAKICVFADFFVYIELLICDDLRQRCLSLTSHDFLGKIDTLAKFKYEEIITWKKHFT